MLHLPYVDISLSVHNQWRTFSRWAVTHCNRVVNWQLWHIYNLSLLWHSGKLLADVVSRLLAGIMASHLVFVGF